MKRLLTILFLLPLLVNAQVNANAGGTYTVDRTQGWLFLDGTGSTGSGTLTYQWRFINPTSQPTEGKLNNATSATPGVKVLPYRGSTAYKYELTVSNGVSTDKDTAIVNVTWNSPFPPQRTTLRTATASDTAAVNINNPGMCRVGDWIVDGANDGWVLPGGQKTDIYISGSITSFTAGQRLFIKGGRYGVITIIFSSGQCTGTQANPSIITNYAGQVECTGISLTNAINVKLTGKFVAGVSGDPSYTGFDGGYAFRQGTFGIWANNRWTSLAGACVGISGDLTDSVELEMIEYGNGQFAGMFIKQNDIATAKIGTIFRGFKVHHTYGHDIHGEGWYWGSTGSDSTSGGTIYQHLIQGWSVYDNIIRGAGNEITQIGQQGNNMNIHNNVFAYSAMNWMSPFDNSQDFGNQMDFRSGGNKFRNNITISSGEQVVSAFNIRKHGITFTGDTNRISNNLFYGGKGFIGNYYGGSNPTPGTLTAVDSNYFGAYSFKANSVFSDSRGTNTQEVFRSQIATSAHLWFRKNQADNSKTGFLTGTAGTFDSSGNQKVSLIRWPQFVNSGFDSSKTNVFWRWADTIYSTWGDEYPNQSAQGVRQGTAYSFSQNDIVEFLGKFYRSRVNSNHGHMPYPADSTYWQIMTWTDGTTTYYYPPDDYRLYSTDTYAQRGIGLSVTYTPSTRYIFTKPRAKKLQRKQ